MYHLQGGGPGGVPPVHVQLGDDEEDGEEEEEEEEEEVGEGASVPQVSGEGAQGNREGGGGGGEEGGGEVSVAEGGANGDVGAQVQHLVPAEDAERMSSSSPSSLFRYVALVKLYYKYTHVHLMFLPL